MQFEQRFGGTQRLYGKQATTAFAKAHVAVIGIGGVGSWVAEALARTAIGQITLIDLDDICVTNTNRQIHAMHSTVGQDKTEAMAARIALINPDCQVNCIEDFVTPDNVASHLSVSQGFDYVIDATDSISAKIAIILHCKRHKIPLITIGGAGGQKDPTQIQVADLTKTIQDPLAAKLRNRLRQQHGFSKNPARKFGIDCVFSTEQLTYPAADGETCSSKAGLSGSTKLDCNSGFGAAVVVTATFGFVAVARVLDKLQRRASAQPG